MMGILRDFFTLDPSKGLKPNWCELLGTKVRKLSPVQYRQLGTAFHSTIQDLTPPKLDVLVNLHEEKLSKLIITADFLNYEGSNYLYIIHVVVVTLLRTCFLTFILLITDLGMLSVNNKIQVFLPLRIVRNT